MCAFDLAEEHSQAIPLMPVHDCVYIFMYRASQTEIIARTSPQQPPIPDTVRLPGSGAPLVLHNSLNICHLRDKLRGSVCHGYFLGLLVELGYSRM